MTGKTQSDTLAEAYFDRNLVVQLAVDLAWDAGYKAGMYIDPSEPDWSVLYIELPGEGQVSWHVPKSELIPRKPRWPDDGTQWDGHDLEEKRRRIRDWLKG